MQNRLKAEGKVLSNIVYMGMGEPLTNYDAGSAAIRRINHPEGLDMGCQEVDHLHLRLAPQIPLFSRRGTPGEPWPFPSMPLMITTDQP